MEMAVQNGYVKDIFRRIIAPFRLIAELNTWRSMLISWKFSRQFHISPMIIRTQSVQINNAFLGKQDAHEMSQLCVR